MALVELRAVTKEYSFGGHLVRALDGVDLAVEGGQLAAVVGPSGSGKTTLLNVLGGMDRPTAGAVTVAGVELPKLDERELTYHRRHRVGFVFQTFNLIPNLSALENVMLPMEFAGVAAREARTRATTLLEKVAMSHRATHRPGRLSGGEQQRVAVARALANDPPILLADEPTGNLDSGAGREIVALLGELAHERGERSVGTLIEVRAAGATGMGIGVEALPVQFFERRGRPGRRPRRAIPLPAA